MFVTQIDFKSHQYKSWRVVSHHRAGEIFKMLHYNARYIVAGRIYENFFYECKRTI